MSPSKTVLESLNAGLHRALAEDERVHLIGEDVLDPYGGAFKVTRGLSSTYPKRVHTTPVSEAGIVGLATGMAMRGLLPVVEIMFGDFTTLIADQIINHLAKFRGMYNDQIRVPMVIRTPMGGRRGYGATHSQTLEKIYLGIPGIQIISPCTLGDPGKLLEHAILKTEDPVLFVENKLIYLEKLLNEETLEEFDLSTIPSSPTEIEKGSPYPTYKLRVRGAPPPTITMTAYGYMSVLAQEAALELAYENEIFVEVLIPTLLAPFEIALFLSCLKETHRLLTVEEGTRSLGWGAEILARAAEQSKTEGLIAQRVAARETPIPASRPLEEATLPGVADIVQAAREMV